MKKPKLLVVTRGFWPLTDDSSMRLLHWTSALVRRGLSVTLLTPRWHSQWPAESQCREVQIVRITPAPRSSWNETYYIRNVGRWIAQHRSEFDVIYVEHSDGVVHQVANKKVSAGLPICGRYNPIGIDNPGRVQLEEQVRLAADACRKLDAVVTTRSTSHRRLSAAGLDDNKIHRIPDVAWNPVRRGSLEDRAAAVRALQNANSDLFLPNEAQLVVTFGSHTPTSGHETLIRAIGPLLEQHQSLRAWSFGGGPGLPILYSQIKDQCWHREFLLQGCFDDLEEILQIAHLVVFPGNALGYEYFLPMVLASGVPFIAADNVDFHSQFGDMFAGALFVAGDEASLRERITSWLQSPIEFEQRASLGRQFALRQLPVESTLDQWLNLFSRLSTS